VLKPVRVAAEKADVAALTGEFPGGGAADAGACPGDNDDFRQDTLSLDQAW
jgi:hypothetical protein